MSRQSISSSSGLVLSMLLLFSLPCISSRGAAQAALPPGGSGSEIPFLRNSAPPTAAKTAKLARVKDVATVEGIRDNQLVGYGLVVGLHGTGDSTQAVFPVQTLISTLERMGVTLPQTGGASTLRVQNMAAVFVTATMGPFLRPGNRLDLTISSAGDARSLEGGVLLMTPLYGPDGLIYAQGQGPLVLGGYEITSNGNSKQFNHPTTGRIPDGAIVERQVPLELKQMHSFSLLLNEADFRTAERMAGAINQELKRPLAIAVDSRRVDLEPAATEDMPALLAEVEAVEVEVYPRAKVVVNERTGTVVIGGDVRLQPVSILHGGLTVNVVSEFQVSQPNSFGQGATQVVQQTQLQTQDRPVSHIELKKGATVDDLVQNLQQIGATARDIISILQAMKEAGALEAELEVL
ncbi:Flagellar P-ring protein FlgI [Acidisarcina polymorpha]|uniref:Flagellar P-ring protein n=1 Tax=Acidisarcina polymorpha TaxID=2211140 RepID=A0A2Z5FU95_9BACT|nr:Flagellar P-ring protein FlgI [Acidisarcina polymorpha]